MFGIFRLLLIAQIGFVSINGTEAKAMEPLVHSRDIVVNRTDEGFTVDVDIVVPVPVSNMWAVITDFERMTDFIPNLTESKVLLRKQNWVRVQQKGYTRIGPFRLDFASTREIQMTPEREMQAHGTAGNLKRVESITRLTTVGTGTRLEYHVEAEPDFWIPPLVGPYVVREQTAEQFSALVGEMIRRR
jgi:ribosome-associated toxin RatA of RatAB toxin-antitoxin module